MHDTPRTRPRGRWLLAVLAALAAAFLLQPPASAQTDSTITWAVTPADEDAPDDRAWVELSLDPGQSVTEHAAVTNLSEVDATFTLSAADGYFTSSGRFNMLPSSEPSTGAGTWIEVEENVAVGAGETVVVPFTITVPENTTPGDHAAGLAASVFTQGEDDAGAAVGVESRVGFRVLTRVTGDLDPSVAVEDLDVSYRTSWNPFAPGRVSIEHELANDGNVRMQVSGEANAQGGSAPLLWQDGSAEPQELLPGESRAVTSEVRQVWPFLRVTAQIVLQPEVLGEDDGPQPAPEVIEEVTVWAVPWPQLIVLLALATAVVLVRRSRKQREARQTAAIEAAKDEVRRELAGQTGTATGAAAAAGAVSDDADGVEQADVEQADVEQADDDANDAGAGGDRD